MLVHFLLGLGLLALVVVAAVFAIRWLTKTSAEVPRERAKDDAEEIVRARYARGEISHGEFARLRRDLA